MNRRGIAMDLPQYVAVVFIMAVLFLITYFIISTINTEVQADSAFAGTPATFYGSMTERMPLAFDSGVILFVFLLAFVLLGLSWLLATNPVLFAILWLVAVLCMILGGFLANAWVDITSSGALAAAAANLEMTNFLLSHYLIFSVVQAILMLIFFFAKQQGGDAL
jgi:hypothetical protein